MAKFSMTKQKFVNQWLQHFAKDVKKELVEKYVKGQYIWHIFSWELVKPKNLLVRDEARRAFDQIPKDDCLCCDMFGDGGVKDELPVKYDTADKIDRNTVEFYVVAKDFSWTYIKTHESEQCGPYFLSTSD